MIEECGSNGNLNVIVLNYSPIKELFIMRDYNLLKIYDPINAKVELTKIGLTEKRSFVY